MSRRDSQRPRREHIYGINPVHEAMKGRRALHRLWYRKDRAGDRRVASLLEEASQRNVPFQEADQHKLDALSQNGNHQGVVLEVGPFSYTALDSLIQSAEGRTVLVLDHVQDPQNLATMIRTAAAVDVAGIVVQTDRSASVTPAVVRSSAGLVEQIPVARENNTRRALDALKEAGYWVVGVEATDRSEDMFEADIPTPAALVVGSEASGISKNVLANCDLVVKLPMPGRVESLNAAVAGSVALFELYRRIRQN